MEVTTIRVMIQTVVVMKTALVWTESAAVVVMMAVLTG